MNFTFNNDFTQSKEYELQVEKAKQQLFPLPMLQELKANDNEEKVIAKFFHTYLLIDYYLIKELDKPNYLVFAHNRGTPEFSEIGIMYEKQFFPIWETETFVVPYERDVAFKPILLNDLKKKLKLK